MDLPTATRLFVVSYQDLIEKGFFQENFGYFCVDSGDVPGSVGRDINAFFLRRLRKDWLWPIEKRYGDYSEEDLFDVIELLFDVVSKPVSGDYHSYSDCGWHYSEFDGSEGRQIYRDEINLLLRDYEDGFELSGEGEILALPEAGLSTLISAELLHLDPDNVELRVQAAVQKFRSRRSSTDERKEAVRALVDVLEFLRPKAKSVLTSKDEGDLFNIANNFAIRHHNVDQRRDYDPAIWLSWMFYFYLATIHAVVRLVRKRNDSLPDKNGD